MRAGGEKGTAQRNWEPYVDPVPNLQFLAEISEKYGRQGRIVRNRSLKVKIYSRELDGPQTLDAFEPKLDGDNEFLMEGYGAEDRYHEWYLAYLLRTSKSGRYFALATIDYGDPQEKSEEGYYELAVVVEDPEASDLRAISTLLIAKYESGNNKTIQSVDQFGEIMEDPKR